MCCKNSFSKAVILDGSILSRNPRTPQYTTATCSSMAIGTKKQNNYLFIKQ